MKIYKLILKNMKLANFSIILLFIKTITSEPDNEAKDQRLSLSQKKFTYSLDNSNNLFSLTTNVGTPTQKLNLVLDTQRSTSILSGSNCQSCKSGTFFDERISSSFKKVQDSYIMYMLNDNFTGILGNDNFYINDLNFNTDFLVLKQIESGLFTNVDGYLGLGPTRKPEDNFANKLKAKNFIDSALFALLLDNNQPMINFGFIDNEIVNKTDQLVSTSLMYTKEEDSFTQWYISPKQFKLGDFTIPYPQKVIINTASNVMRIPKKFYDTFKRNIFKKESLCIYGKDNYFRCKCDANSTNLLFANFTLELDDGKIIYLQPADYIYQEASESDNTKNCILGISLNFMNDYWILGNIFVNNYYTIFDIDNNKLSFKDVRNTTFGSISWTLIFCTIILLCSIVFFVIIYIIYKKIMNRRGAQGAGYEIVQE
jgi:gastricsin